MERESRMNLSEIPALIKDFNVIEKDCEKIHICIQTNNNTTELLRKVKALGYAAFVHVNAMGIEIVVTDRLKQE